MELQTTKKLHIFSFEMFGHTTRECYKTNIFDLAEIGAGSADTQSYRERDYLSEDVMERNFSPPRPNINRQ